MVFKNMISKRKRMKASKILSLLWMSWTQVVAGFHPFLVGTEWGLKPSRKTTPVVFTIEENKLLIRSSSVHLSMDTDTEKVSLLETDSEWTYLRNPQTHKIPLKFDMKHVKWFYQVRKHGVRIKTRPLIQVLPPSCDSIADLTWECGEKCGHFPIYLLGKIDSKGIE